MDKAATYENIKSRVIRFTRKNWLFVSVITVLLLIALVFIMDSALHELKSGGRQEALGPFYSPPDPLPGGNPGDLIRMEPLDAAIPAGAQGFRILYLSQRGDGTPVAASGMVFVPTGQVPEGGRPVVAWAHPTVGMGDQCAPSRAADPLASMSWLEDMLDRGWVVTATDYAGLGTPGNERYLVGRDEARDVINSVRAVRNMEEAAAGTDFAVWSHSQGGHAALFTSLEAAGYAPELNLVATAAAAPAAELTALISEQYTSDVDWVIGPEVLVSWPEAYPDLSREQVVTSTGLKKYEELANDCLLRAGGEAVIRSALKQDFFRIDPTDLPSWYSAAASETPVMPAGSKPLFIAQGLEDKVVLPGTTALFVQRSCQAGIDLTTLWLGGTNHVEAARVAGPAAVSWLDERFQGKPTSPTCDQPLPVEPVTPPAPPAGS